MLLLLATLIARIADGGGVEDGLVDLTCDGVLRPWGAGIHVATGTTTFLRVPIWNNTAVIELAGGLLVWNPIAREPPLRSSVDALCAHSGRTVTALVCAMDWHHRSVADWQAAYPEADTVWVSDRIAAHADGLTGRALPGATPRVPGAEAELALVSVEGCVQPVLDASRGAEPRREWLVYHRPSRSLLIGDLLFVNARVGLAERLVGFRPGFTYNRHGFRVRDRAAFDAFVDRVLEWDAAQVLTAHGRATAHGVDFVRQALTAALRPGEAHGPRVA